jgi:Tol biopolymer transport system component
MNKNMLLSFRLSILSPVLALAAVTTSIHGSGLQSQDLYRFRSVSDVEVSPDGRHIAYAVTMNDRPGRPYTQIWIMDLVNHRSARIGTEKEASSHPRWSPDGKMIAFMGGQEEKPGLMYAKADGSGETFLTVTASTNSPLPGQGKTFTWSPDSKTIGYVSATPGPETQNANADPW